ncbi:hypothetical protein KEM54_005617 [Ascosphaera aggregata]|nr:hypothetical protein KEM54_005617 [Ascosphaera aggregata]
MTSTLRRLMKEAEELSSKSPSASPDFTAYPISDSNLFEWHFTISGPPSTPYANGIYHGRITLPQQYPLRPPSFRFLTPSGRFEVNCKICLSISGHHEETWQPAWGIRTALMAIRAFMASDARGQVGGIDASDEVRMDWARRSTSWTCNICGKTNEAILYDWRRELQENGILHQGSHQTKDEATEHEVRQESVDSNGKDAVGGHSAEPHLQQHNISTSAGSGTDTAASDAVVTSHASARSTQEAQQERGQQLQEGEMQEFPRRSVQVEPLSEDKFLDLAITGVFIALLFIILKKAMF